jgi:uncharacterized protein YcfJ
LRRLGIGAAIAMAASLSCVRYARFQGVASQTGTCDGACGHYLACKDDQRPESLRSCQAGCRDIFVDHGEPDRDSLRLFEGLECSAAVGFVEGDSRGHSQTATTHAPARSGTRAQ